MKIIYDFGSNNGDDIPYYFKKADVVIAVEANPVLCEHIVGRFHNEINSGKLFVENCVLNTDGDISETFFYIHKSEDVLSQFPTPSKNHINDFRRIALPALSPLKIIHKYGPPFYIKIDVEHYDQEILRHLFHHRIFPSFISAESHSIDIFCLFVVLGEYNSFKLVDGHSVSTLYKKARIITNNGSEVYSFPYHSAGPFGDDLKGEWMTAANFMCLLACEGLGWKDIHATNVINPTDADIRLKSYLEKAIMQNLKGITRSCLRPFLNSKSVEVLRAARASIFPRIHRR